MIYLGTTVLTEDPNRKEVPTHTLLLSKARNDSLTGAFSELVKAPVQQQTRPFNWFMGSRADIVAFETFRAARKGRLAPFWVPTWQHDLYLQSNIAAGDTILPMVNVGYTKYFWDADNRWRRYLAFIQIGTGINFIRRIDSATEDTGLQETIELDSGVPVNLVVGQWMLSYLTMCRLDSDVVVMKWLGENIAEAALTFRELPLEVP